MHRRSWWAQTEQLVGYVVYMSALEPCSRRHSVQSCAEQTAVICAFEGYPNTEEEILFPSARY